MTDVNDEYSKREIDVFLSDLRAALTRNEQDLNTIKQQTIKTNGSVADLKEKQIRADERYKTASKLIGVALTIIIPSLGWMFVQFYDLNGGLDKRISTTINTALTNYGLIRH